MGIYSLIVRSPTQYHCLLERFKMVGSFALDLSATKKKYLVARSDGSWLDGPWS